MEKELPNSKFELEHRKSIYIVCICYFLLLLFYQADISTQLLLLIADGDFWNKYFNLLFYLIFTIIFVAFYKKNLIRMLKDIKNNIDRYTTYSLVCLFVILILMIGSAILLSQFSIGDSANQQEVDKALEEYRIITALVTCLFGPFVEEIVFRGIIYGTLRRILRNRVGIFIAISITALIFGLYHCDLVYILNGEYEQILTCIPLCFVGFGLSFLYEKTKNIFCPIAVHLIINFIATFG